MAADALRWFVLLEGSFVLGLIGALYYRVARYIVPTLPSRLVITCCAALVLGMMTEIRTHMGEPLTWRTPAAILIAGTLLVALGRLYFWTRHPNGREARHRLIADYLADRMQREVETETQRLMDEERQEHLSRAVKRH